MGIIGLIFTLFLALIVIAFTLLNAQGVEVNYLIGSAEMPLAVVLLLSLIVGMLITAFLMGISLIKLKSKNKSLENKLKHSQTLTTEPQH